MYCQLYYFLEQNDCLYTQQFGFCNSPSTNKALINITEKIRKALHEGNFAVVYFSTFRRLLTLLIIKYISKLEYYGV